MTRSALVGAALFAAVAAILTIGIAGASASHAPKVLYSPVYVSIADGSAVEGQTGALSLSVVRPISPLLGVQTHIYWKTIAGGNAMLGTDYAAQNGMATLAPGQASKDIMVGSIDDNIYQLDHTFKVQIWSTDPWVVITRNTATFTIHDNDKRPAVHISDAPDANEGGDLTYTFTLSNPSYQTISVNWVVWQGAGSTPWVHGVDYSNAPSTTVTFAPYQTSKTVTFNTLKDGDVLEYVWLHLKSATNAELPYSTSPEDGPWPDYTTQFDPMDNWGLGTVHGGAQ